MDRERARMATRPGHRPRNGPQLALGWAQPGQYPGAIPWPNASRAGSRAADGRTRRRARGCRSARTIEAMDSPHARHSLLRAHVTWDGRPMRGYGHSSESAKPRSLPRRLLIGPHVRGTRPGRQWQRIPPAHAPRRRAGRAGTQHKPSDPRPRRRADPPGKARATGRHSRAEGARPDDRSD